MCPEADIRHISLLNPARPQQKSAEALCSETRAAAAAPESLTRLFPLFFRFFRFFFAEAVSVDESDDDDEEYFEDLGKKKLNVCPMVAPRTHSFIDSTLCPLATPLLLIQFSLSISRGSITPSPYQYTQDPSVSQEDLDMKKLNFCPMVSPRTHSLFLYRPHSLFTSHYYSLSTLSFKDGGGLSL